MNSSEPDKLVVIGASTGGPKHIQKILHSLKPDFNASIIVAQHMDPEYISSFVKLLDAKSCMEVQEVQETARLKPSSVYVCSHSSVLTRERKNILITPTKSRGKGYNPNINMLFESAASVADRTEVLGVILTGIGDDGAKGCLLLTQAGGRCIAESKESAIVYGMPMRAYELNNMIEVKHLDEIIEAIKVFGA